MAALDQPTSFPCFLVHKGPNGQISSGVATRRVDELPPGELLIEVAWSSLNYKDALAATGHPGVVRKFPHVPGIDVAGVVVESHAGQFKPGDPVLVTGHELGAGQWGGYAGLARVPAAWALPLPAGLSFRESMIYGTAGLTAAQSVHALEQQGIRPGDELPVVVTGATGGVGCLAVGILARLGYAVAAVSGKPQAESFLVGRLGAKQVLPRSAVEDTSDKPLLPARWSGAIDTVGGNPLATLLRSTRRAGVVTACGLVAGSELKSTVYPFILRGVTLCGIDSAECPHDKRQLLWQKLATSWRPAALESLAETIELADLPDRVGRILAGQVQGRLVVRLSGK